jgi:putative transposase
MPDYRRVKIKGGTYFLTLVTYNRQKLFFNPNAVQLFYESLNHVRKYHPFSLIAYCILPDHIHLLLRLPDDDSNYSSRISQIKRRYSKSYLANYPVPDKGSASREKRKEAFIWQRRFWEHYIRDEEDLNRHIDYIHYNPVKHGLVNKVSQWKESSFFKFVQMEIYDLDWGEAMKDTGNQKYLYGE